MSHLETSTQIIVILKTHSGMMTRPQDHRSISCTSHLLTENQYYYHTERIVGGENIFYYEINLGVKTF
jgi:hypothetical protein